MSTSKKNLFRYSNLARLFIILAFSTLVQVNLPELAYGGRCASCSAEKKELKICGGCKSEHYCGESCQKAAWPSHKDSCKSHRPYKDLANGVEVRPSRIAGAGNGLFANQEFSPGDLVAAYTGQILPDELAPRIQFGASSYLQNMEGESVILIGDPHPSTPHLGAQLANDPLLEAEDLRMLLAVNCNDSRPESLAPFKAFTQKYWARTLEGRDNVLLDSRPFGPTSLPVFKAIRPIRAGEEILYPYGASYWLMSAVQICHRKGLSETGLAIQRAASAAVEEAARSARNPIHQLLFQGIIEMDSAYISEETYQRRLAVFKAIPLETKIIHLFAPAGQMGLTPTGTREDDLELLKTRSELMEKFGLKEKLLTLAEIPNSEFFDEHSYGKPHARSKQIMTEFVQFLKDSGQAKVGWFFDIKKHRPIAWDDFIRMIAH